MCSVLFSYAVVKVRAIPIRLLFRHIGMVDVILTQLPMNVNLFFLSGLSLRLHAILYGLIFYKLQENLRRFSFLGAYP